MITLQIGIGGVLMGLLGGVAISYFTWWLVERNMGDDFHRGWDAGYEYGKERGKREAEKRRADNGKEL